MESKTQRRLYYRLIDDKALDNCIKALFIAQQSSDEILEVIVQPESRKRSLASNRLMWLWITQAANHWGNTKEEVHHDFKRRFLLKIYYRDDAQFATMCHSIKALQKQDIDSYNSISSEVIRLTSTAKATDKQMSEYLDDVYRFCYAEGLFLLTPEELKWIK